ncbi:YfdY family protein [Salmonella enterica]|nr:YfdY family protein [Salmonella enterica]EGM2983195.1 YfdY family protein [Salmonella enterica]
MIYLWTFLAISILAVSGYIGQVMGAFSAVSSFTGMVILAALIYLLNVWLQDGDDIVSGLFLFLAPACGLIIRFMVGYGKR